MLRLRSAPNAGHLDTDDTGAGRLACRTTRQDLRADQLRPLPLDRSRDPKSAQDRPAVPNPALATRSKPSARLSPKVSILATHQCRHSSSIPDQINDLLVVSEDPRIDSPRFCPLHSACTVQAIISFAIRPNPSLNAATAAAGFDLVKFLALLEQARCDHLSALVDNPRRQSDLGRGLGIRRDPKTSDVDQKLEIGLADIRDAQRRVSDVVIFKALDQPRLQQLRNSFGPEKIRKSRNVLGRREQHSLGLKHRNRGRLRNRQLPLDGLACRPQILRRPANRK